MISKATKAQIAAQTAAIKAKIAAEIENDIKRYKETFSRKPDDIEASSASPTTSKNSWFFWSGAGVKDKSLARSVASEFKIKKDLFNSNYNLAIVKKDY